MNSVDFLLTNKDITYEIRTEIKRLGRPIPDLIISKTDVGKSRNYSPNFNSSVYDIFNDGWQPKCMDSRRRRSRWRYTDLENLDEWWPRIIWHFIDVAVVNASIIYQERCGGSTGLSLKDFRLAVVAGLIGAGKNINETRTTRASLEPKKPVNNYKRIIPIEQRVDQ
ncbi:hypothetical protein NQ318_000638 [Aromia moschata]|uniref:PiggyBac transposable element-derived protein domain-containing protein n=1 Tax=Aromia moschata TaxID=1265417 RepID=A0AAV8XHK9_9CUCU|nr:hypothetical protein NQ318_000638 [Aromia moschata]